MKTQQSVQELKAEHRKYFPEGKIEDITQKPPYITRTVTLEEMKKGAQEAAVEANAWMFEGKKR